MKKQSETHNKQCTNWKWKSLIMQETEIYKWLESFCAVGQGREFSRNSEFVYEIFIARSRKWTVYRQESGRRIDFKNSRLSVCLSVCPCRRTPAAKRAAAGDAHRRLRFVQDYPDEPAPERYKKLSYRRGTARCVLSVIILPITTQQCRNYLYDKSWPNRWY